MQKNKRLDPLSRWRQTLRHLLAELEQCVEGAMGRAPLVRGNVYELARKCGKPGCVCARGRLHRSMVLTWSEAGRSKLWSIPAERLSELQVKSEAYRRSRRARARVTVLSKKILAVMDRIEQLRREEP